MGFESTSTYHWPLQMALAESAALARFSPEICSFNARLIDNFKKSYDNLPKDNWTDAFIIAERLQFKRLPPEAKWTFVSFHYKG